MNKRIKRKRIKEDKRLIKQNYIYANFRYMFTIVVHYIRSEMKTDKFFFMGKSNNLLGKWGGIFLSGP